MHLAFHGFLTALTVVQPMTGIVGAVIAYMLFRLSREQRRDGINRTYKDLHEGFFNDKVLAKVRKYLACDQAYVPVKDILQKRKQIEAGTLPASSMNPDEYDVLEEIDAFLNFMVRVSAVAPQFARTHASWREHLMDYWVRRMQKPDREDFYWYANKFFPWVFSDYQVQGLKKEMIPSRAAGTTQPPIPRILVAEERPQENAVDRGSSS